MSVFKKAALKILEESGRPMHSKEITSIALKAKLIPSTGKTPAATMNARLSEDIKHGGDRSPFVKAGPSIFALRDLSARSRKIQPEDARIAENKTESRSDKQNNSKRLLDHLGTFDKSGVQLEKVVCEMLKLDPEYEDVTTTQASKDKGVDVVANYLGDKFAPRCRVFIQVKNYQPSKRIGPDPIRRLRGSGQREPGHSYRFWLITTGDFTPEARRAAEEDFSGFVKLTNGEEFVEMLIKSNVGIGHVFPAN